MTAAGPFDYSNLNARPPGRVLSALGRVLPGIRAVQDQVVPFAQAWQRANRAALERDGPLWVVLGDSMSQGIGAPAHDRGWVGQLAARWQPGGRPYRILNLSVSGARIADLLDRQLPVLETLLASGAAPALVTVLIGSNDLVRRDLRRQAPARFDQLLARLPVGTIVATLPNPSAEVQAINAAIERAAAAGRVRVADLRPYPLPAWRGRLATDWFHPNERGYTLLADAFAAAR